MGFIRRGKAPRSVHIIGRAFSGAALLYKNGPKYRANASLGQGRQRHSHAGSRLEILRGPR